MAMDNFASYLKINGCFIVQNISPQVKTIKIFNYPINYMDSRDLLQIPGVGENDIRASLLKGEVNHKIRAGDIRIICSDIDLLQFNSNQKMFLQMAGVIKGLEIDVDNITANLDNYISSGGSGGISASQHETLRQLIHFVDEGPGDGFASGAYKEVLPIANPFPTSMIWYLDSSKNKKLVEKLLSYNSNGFPTTITWNMYDADGVSILHTVVDTISYVNGFETTRTRTII